MLFIRNNSFDALYKKKRSFDTRQNVDKDVETS